MGYCLPRAKWSCYPWFTKSEKCKKVIASVFIDKQHVYDKTFIFPRVDGLDCSYPILKEKLREGMERDKELMEILGERLLLSKVGLLPPAQLTLPDVPA